MIKDKKFDEKVFKKIVNNLLDNFDKEHLESPIFKHIVNNKKWLDNPDHVYTMIVSPFKRCVELAINMTQEQKNEVTTLWLNYQFLERNISELCNWFYGHAYCVDRGRFIVKSYIEYIKTGIMPKLNWKQQYTFHYPKKGTLKQWFSFVEVVHRLKYGCNKEYLVALKTLIDVHRFKTKVVKGKNSASIIRRKGRKK